MLNRLVILNSATYGKASIRFDDADSIQVVGPNNVGKSTFIFALNFLYIIDGKRMAFKDNKPLDKEAIHHYLPSPTNSYLIFEIFKQRYYCILVKRNSDGDLEYYRIDHEYKEELFIQTHNNQQTILKFDELYARLVTSGITVEEFKDKRDVFNFVYQRTRRNNAVVWLENSVTSDGLSNNFSKIYQYLINAKLITNKTLKQALIIADNRDKEPLNFSQKSRKDINDLLRINDEVRAISSIQNDFHEFREIANQYKAKTRILSELLYSFNSLYSPTLIDQEFKYFEKKNQLDATRIELDETLNPKKQTLDREIGAKENELERINKLRTSIQTKLNEIKSFEGIDFLRQTLLNLDEKRRNLESSITRTETLSVNQIEQKIRELTKSSEKVDSQIKGYSNQLIHKIASKQADREKLNSILSSEFASFPSEAIEKPISTLTTPMSLFDGKIKLPENLQGKPIPSIEELSNRLTLDRAELEQYKKLLPVAQDFENSKTELNKLNAEIAKVKTKVELIESIPSLNLQLQEQKDLFRELSESKTKVEGDLARLNEEIRVKTNSIPILDKAKNELDKRILELKRWKEDTEKIAIDPVANETTETLNQIYSRLTLTNGDRDRLKINKDKSFESLKHRVKSLEADEEAFIKFVADEIACLSDKRKSVETILQAISTQFANPAYLMIKRFGEFKEFINNKFNAKLSKTKISDIESLKIVLNESNRILDDLKKISSIQELAPQTNFNFDNDENLKILNSYLDSGRKIEFEELFDIELHLTKDGKEKKVDLKEQVESTGTDLMIRMVFITSVINKLAINDRSNRIPIAIDEIARVDGANRLELFKFCKEHNLIPVCTSIDETILDGFEKYIMIFRSASKAKINISEGSPNVMRQEPVTA